MASAAASVKESDQNYPLYRVEHFRQRWNWDCGVSCVLMLLTPDQRSYFLKEFQNICHEEAIEGSTWTIDLCYLLKRFDIKHTMYTALAGVNEEYTKHNYYCNVIDNDRSRVEGRFKLAAEAGIEVYAQPLSELRLRKHLRSAPAILLVDAGLLACDICKHNKLKSEFRSCFGGSYKGHYILVVGVSRSKYWYRDPALAPRLCAAGRAALARACGAAGTDHDCILLHTDA